MAEIQEVDARYAESRGTFYTIRRLFIWAALIFLAIGLVMDIASRHKGDKTRQQGAAAARGQEVWELCATQTPEACKNDYVQGLCGECSRVTLLDLRTMFVRGVNADGNIFSVHDGEWEKHSPTGQLFSGGKADLRKLSEGFYQGTFTDPKSGETGSLVLRRR